MYVCVSNITNNFASNCLAFAFYLQYFNTVHRFLNTPGSTKEAWPSHLCHTHGFDMLVSIMKTTSI